MNLEQTIPNLTEPMKLVLDQKYRLYDTLISANQKLDERADRLVQTSSIVIGIGAFANLPTIIVGGSALLFLVIIIISHYAFRPIVHQAPGDSDWNRTFNDYLNSTDYFNQLLSDLLTSIKSNEQANLYKSKWIPRLIWLLILQVLLLLITWLYFMPSLA